MIGLSRSRFWPAAVLLCAAALVAADVSADALLGHVKFLASPELKGRGNGTPELERAAEYIAARLKRYSVQPLGSVASFFQPFEVTTDVKLGPRNRLSVELAEGKRLYEVEQDYLILGFSEEERVRGEVVFAGYGITAPEYGYDDYQGLDVEGKVVLVLDHEPQELIEGGAFEGTKITFHAAFHSKAANAKRRGAAALLLVADAANHAGASGMLAERLRYRRRQAEELGIVALEIAPEIAGAMFAARGLDPIAVQREIDHRLSPASQPLGLSVEVSLDVTPVKSEVRNVVGVLRGAGPRAGEYVIIGAHYDHLGLGSHGSLVPESIGTPHPGADDNASGTAALLELARLFSKNQKRLGRSLIFIAFAGEELGLRGSGYFIKNPPVPLEKVVAMVNLDMIGRVREGRLYVGGAGTSPAFPPLLERANRRVGLDLKISSSAMSASDHMQFELKGIPVLFFFSGLHADYHRPSDTWDKLSIEALKNVAELVYLVVEDLSRVPERPPYTRTEHAMPVSTGGSGYGPYFGSIPDFSDDIAGVRFAAIREGSPAARAGLRAGDVLIEFDGRPIENLVDFTYALRSKKPGDEVEVVVLRDARQVKARVRLEQRR